MPHVFRAVKLNQPSPVMIYAFRALRSLDVGDLGRQFCCLFRPPTHVIFPCLAVLNDCFSTGKIGALWLTGTFPSPIGRRVLIPAKGRPIGHKPSPKKQATERQDGTVRIERSGEGHPSLARGRGINAREIEKRNGWLNRSVCVGGRRGFSDAMAVCLSIFVRWNIYSCASFL